MKNVILFVSLAAFMQACVSMNWSDNDMLLGRWCLENSGQLNYPTVTFSEDGLAIFDSRMDTVYMFRYYANDGILSLVQSNGGVTEDVILFLSADSLVFKTLQEHDAIQVYRRCY